MFQKKLFIEFVHGVKSEHAYWQHKHDRKKIGTFSAFPLECRTILWFFRNDSRLYISKIILFRLEGSWYSKWPAWDHGFNAKIGFEKYAMSPKIFTKMCQNSGRQTKPGYFETFWQISQDLVHIFSNRFLSSNRELKPVVLSTMNPINEKKKF